MTTSPCPSTLRSRRFCQDVYKTRDKHSAVLSVVSEMQMAMQRGGRGAAKAEADVEAEAPEEVTNDMDTEPWDPAALEQPKPLEPPSLHPGYAPPCGKCGLPTRLVSEEGRLLSVAVLREHLLSLEHDLTLQADWLRCRKCLAAGGKNNGGGFRCASIWALQLHAKEAHGFASTSQAALHAGFLSFDRNGDAEVRQEAEAVFPLTQLRMAEEAEKAESLLRTAAGRRSFVVCRRCCKAIKGRKAETGKLSVTQLRAHAWTHVSEADGAEALWDTTTHCFPEILQEADRLPHNA